jgi:hypothetical protein
VRYQHDKQKKYYNDNLEQNTHVAPIDRLKDHIRLGLKKLQYEGLA